MSHQVIPQTLSLQVIPQLMCCLKSFLMHIIASRSPLTSPGQSPACVTTSCSLGVCRCTIRVKNTSQSSACVTTSHSSVMCHLKSILSMCHSKLFFVHVSLQVVPHPCITTSHSSFMSPQVSPQHVSLQAIPHPLSKLSLIYGRNGVKLVITMLATQ